MNLKNSCKMGIVYLNAAHIVLKEQTLPDPINTLIFRQKCHV